MIVNRISKSTEDYLKCVYKLSLDLDPVLPNHVADELNISAAAVTKMIKRLKDMNMIRYARAKGITLTPKGKQIALHVLRHHRLLELFLNKLLGFTWDRVHEEAERLEHVISEEFEDRIDRLLGYPTHDPHGAPIPTKDLHMPDEQYPRLVDLNDGDHGWIQYIGSENPQLLRYIGEMGMYPGAKIRLMSREPFNGPITLLVSDKAYIIGPELAKHIYVKVEL